jgi:S-DNA-T family DNA segregation ATPase FtsK/SpoIIIE
MGKLGGGDKKDDAKPASSSSSMSAKPAGGSSSASAAKKDDKSQGGGLLGGITNRFGGGGKDEKPTANAPSQQRPASPGVSSSSGYSSSSASSSSGARPFGASGSPSSAPAAKPGMAPSSAAKTPAKKTDKKGGGVAGLVRGILPFGAREPSRNAKAQRTGKTVEVKTVSLSMDKGLEIVGIVLVIFGAVMLLSSLSPSPGSLIDGVNGFFSKLFGWGSVIVAIAFIPIGIWLVTLKVGQEAPVIDPLRVIGVLLLFMCVLALMQFIDALSYPPSETQTYDAYLASLKTVMLPLSSEFGRGGGRVGGEIYYFLISNFSELAGFVLLIGVLVIALMLTLSVSAQEVFAVAMGNGRNVRDAFSRRRTRITAQRAERAAAVTGVAVAATTAAALASPNNQALPAPNTPALPAPAIGMTPALAGGAAQTPLDLTKAEERNIPITMGGRTFTANMRPGEPALVDAAPAPATSVSPTASLSPSTMAASPTGASAPPVSPAKPTTTAPAPTDQSESKGGLFSRFKTTVPAAGAATAGAVVVAAKVTADALTPDPDTAQAATTADKPDAITETERGRFGVPNPFKRPGEPVKSPSEPVASSAAADAPPRMGDLLRSDASKTASPSPAMSAGGISTAPSTAQPYPRPTTGTGSPSASGNPLSRIGSPTPGSAAAAAKDTPVVGETNSDADKTDSTKSSAFSGLSKLNPAASMAPVKSASAPPRRSPIEGEEEYQDFDEDDDALLFDDDEDEEETGDWAKLPPAQPRGITAPPVSSTSNAALSRPPTSLGATSTTGLRPFGSPAAKPSEGGDQAAPKPAAPAASTVSEPIPDLQTRLNTLRGMQVGAKPDEPKSASPVSEKRADSPETKDENAGGLGAVAAVGAVVAAGAVGAAAAKLMNDDDDEDSEKVITSGIPANLAAPLPKPPERPASPTYGKPDDGIRDPSGAMATSRTSTFGAPRPYSPSGSSPASPSAPPPASATPSAVSAPPPPPPPVRPVPTPAAPAASAAAMPSGTAQSQPEPPPPPRKVRKDWRSADISELLGAGMDQELNHDALLQRARIIEDTLSSFGAPGRVVEVRTGPVVTQFGVEPDYIEARGGKKNRVKVSAIAALDKDLQLALGAKSIRIEAPVPGKGYVGIEVPNEKPAIVRLRDVMESPEFRRIQSPLAIALGQGVDGTPVAGDLSGMPHLLIAGTTGSGKSVCVNAIIASLLLSNTPERLKFIMIDPKRVELTGYNGIPHLVAPVVVELERIVSVLKWVTREMDERYRRFSLAAARNIEDFNKHLPSGEVQMPYIVVIIDELADLMMLAPDETEKVITRLAALARATGIHLVIATQRPSVDVVTGLIKANFPARIAFAVAGSVDSRVILDQPGAERLLGRGDMLYMSGDSPAPVRLQGVFLSDTEISNITRFWRNQLTDADLANAGKPILSQFALDEMAADKSKEQPSAKPWSPGMANRASGTAYWDREATGQSSSATFSSRSNNDDDGGDGDEDALYEEAVDLVRRQNKASVSLLQRRFRIGYTRAARLMDTLEERGIVGPPVEGAKPREVLPPRR